MCGVQRAISHRIRAPAAHETRPENRDVSREGGSVMARRNTLPAATGGPAETSGERLSARAASKLAVLAPPWLMLGATAGAGAVSHAVWGQAPEVTWAAMAGTLATTGLTGLTWAITHARRVLGRVHATATTGAAGAWLTVVTVTG